MSGPQGGPLSGQRLPGLQGLPPVLWAHPGPVLRIKRQEAKYQGLLRLCARSSHARGSPLLGVLKGLAEALVFVKLVQAATSLNKEQSVSTYWTPTVWTGFRPGALGGSESEREVLTEDKQVGTGGNWDPKLTRLAESTRRS